MKYILRGLIIGAAFCGVKYLCDLLLMDYQEVLVTCAKHISNSDSLALEGQVSDFIHLPPGYGEAMTTCTESFAGAAMSMDTLKEVIDLLQSKVDEAMINSIPKIEYCPSLKPTAAEVREASNKHRYMAGWDFGIRKPSEFIIEMPFLCMGCPAEIHGTNHFVVFIKDTTILTNRGVDYRRQKFNKGDTLLLCDDCQRGLLLKRRVIKVGEYKFNFSEVTA